MYILKFQIEEDGKVAYYIDGKDEATSNWMRYVNCPKNSDEENLKTWPYKKSIYYITNSTVEPDTELLVWCGGDYAKDHGVLPPEPGRKAQKFQHHNANEFSLCLRWFP